MKSVEPKIGEYGLRAESARSVQKTFFSFLFFIALLFFSACAIKTAKFTTSELRSNSAQTKLLILEPHVAIHEVSMGGAIEPKADWTEAGTKNIIQALKDTFQDRNVTIKFHKNTSEQSDANTQTLKLFQTVGKSIYNHYYVPRQNLPSKKKFNWSVGNTLSGFGDQFNPDYVLYVYMEDTHSSSGRVALGVVTYILFGHVTPAGMQQGIAFLVDTNSGEVVWFNRLMGESFGDVRELKTTKVAIQNLLSEFPK
tara:strand:+ start:99 stop:860 length:762 start_codon:yes stop_codon:yes gene_type:complete